MIHLSLIIHKNIHGQEIEFNNFSFQGIEGFAVQIIMKVRIAEYNVKKINLSKFKGEFLFYRKKQNDKTI